jgi:hypothetical protein
MKRIAALMFCAVVCVALSGTQARASWSECCYSGYQPWWNIFAKRYKCITPEEERLQKFWHDYYDAMKNYYGALDHIDWVAYYKNHGYQINGGCCGPCGPGRINYAPVFVNPQIQWAMPNSCMSGPAAMPMFAPSTMPAGGFAGPGCPVGPGGNSAVRQQVLVAAPRRPGLVSFPDLS